MFRVRNVPAALYKALGGFATNAVNMTKLESYMVGGHFVARGVALLRTLRQRPREDFFQNARQRGVVAEQRIGIVFQNAPRNQVALKGVLEGEEFKEHHGGGEQVRAAVAS